MPNHRLSLRSTVAQCLLLGAFVAGCSDSNSPTQQDKDVASLRQAIASIQPLSAAQQAGYSVAVGDPT